jgi:hypothetical protein
MTQVILDPLGGEMPRIGDADLALNLPRAKWSYFCLALWPDPAGDDANVAWAGGLAEAMRPHAVGSPYAAARSWPSSHRDEVGVIAPA